MVSHVTAQCHTGRLLGTAQLTAILVVALAIVVACQMLAQTAIVTQPAAAEIALHLGDRPHRMQRLLVYEEVCLGTKVGTAHVTDDGREVGGVHALYVRRQLQLGAETRKGERESVRGRQIVSLAMILMIYFYTRCLWCIRELNFSVYMYINSWSTCR